MTTLKILICLIVLSFAPQAFAAAQAFPSAPSTIDLVVKEAIGRSLIAGGIVLVGNRDGILFERAYGKVSTLPDAPFTDSETIFDLASLTKVFATAPSVLKLAEEGRLSLLDPIIKWYPELAGHGKDQIKILNLLTHTSGLDDFSLSAGDALGSAIRGVADQKLKGEVGNRFRYADINFILLAEIVRRATGAPLDVYAQASFYRPLAMTDTGFRPARRLRCAVTFSEEGPRIGEPQDSQCRQLGGVAGHAGLFSTARDLSRFCRMILSGGVLDGKRVLQERTVAQMSVPYYSRRGQVARGLGWDIDSPYSAPRGTGFSRISFGHTGYSGSSVWIDPAADTFVILLTTRLDYAHVREFNRLRSEISTVASAVYGSQTGVKDARPSHDE
ncbi:serine hydrolase domain-containing protein [Geomesophilobacter sediminis]|uniref:Beta-lactamase family protein n=1 Tax=Geomesophilobacter sediminis TaxID=2798584 RepID=A0A8J7JCT4_9BACT|nr:serine hydrolase domain-containing protein [Geomesophilobacter sediminis]MBJ6725136.1 beta-lactamase family protein [Geomesophilobacter sediminis]